MNAYNPRTVKDTLELLHRLKDQKVRLIAGGTDLMVFLREKKVQADYLIDINGIEELRYVKKEKDRLVIGPLMTHHELAGNVIIRHHAPLLAQGCHKVGSPQIRHRGTIGGNVCTGSPAGDTLPPLAVQSASFTVESLQGSRTIAFADFFTGPQKTVLKPDELVTAIAIDSMDESEQSSFQWMGTRKALSITKVSLAARCTVEKGVLGRVRLALGSVAPVVKRATAAEEVLEGKSLSAELADAAAEAILKDSKPIDDIRSTGAYRHHITAVLLKRFLEGLPR